jgi:RHS repeat-associated protein
MSFSYDFHLGTSDNGNVFTIRNDRDDNRTQNFTYDALNRIATSYTNGSNWGEDFTIDAWGNLSNRSAHPGKTNYEPLNAAATNQNRLTGFGYDAAGNMTSNGGASYTYDAENHLVLTSGYAYFYDGDGNRVKKCTSTAAFTCQASPTGTLYWRAGGGDPLIESTLGGTNQEEYIFFTGKRIARRDVSNSAVHYYFSDHLGSTSMTTDANGTMSACPTNSNLVTGEDESDYYPYGGEQSLCNRVPQNYKFTGKERDSESGLDNFGARHDASNLGRFMSVDPLLSSASIAEPQSWNRFAYVRNNPLRFTDPTGMWDWDESAGGSASDDELRVQCEHGRDKKTRNAAKRALQFRQRFRDALEAADDAAGSQKLTDGQSAAVQAAVDAYGEENDDNGVKVGIQLGYGGSTVINNDDTVSVTLGSSLKGDFLTATVAHEGTHLGEDQAWLRSGEGTVGDLSRYATEADAWTVGAFVAQALNVKNYRPHGGDKNMEMWNKGWAAADVETLRDRGLVNILSYYRDKHGEDDMRTFFSGDHHQ